MSAFTRGRSRSRTGGGARGAGEAGGGARAGRSMECYCRRTCRAATFFLDSGQTSFVLTTCIVRIPPFFERSNGLSKLSIKLRWIQQKRKFFTYILAFN